MTNIETRDFQIREFNEELREVTGLAVPYGQTVNVGAYQERFERGAFSAADDVKLFYGHTEPIGRVIRAEDTDEGYLVTAKISKTVRGDEVYTLLNDKVLSNFSVGFIPAEQRDEDGVIVRTKVDLKEVSIVPIPAYSGAKISEVRASDNTNNDKEESANTDSLNNMTEAVNYDDSEVRGSIENLERRLAVAENNAGGTATNATQFRSYGSLVKGLVENPEAAKVEARAFTGVTLANDDGATRPAWIAQQLRVLQEQRPVTGLFKKIALPSSGMSITIPVVATESGTVGKQASEGADLPYMEVTTQLTSFPVNTYGGYTSLSAQAIERSEVGMLDLNLDYLVQQYASATEKAVRDTLVGATGTNTAVALGTGTETAVKWIDAIFKAAAAIDDNGRGAKAEFVLVSRDVFLRLAHLTDTTGRPVFVVNGDGQNTFGNVNIGGLSANIAGLPVVVGTKLADGTAWVASRDALFVAEDPFKSLQDQNIINLTKDFSVYGYLATGVLNAKGLTKVNTATA